MRFFPLKLQLKSHKKKKNADLENIYKVTPVNHVVVVGHNAQDASKCMMIISSKGNQRQYALKMENMIIFLI